VTCSRSELLAALHRLSAVCNAEPPPLVAVSWRSEGRLYVVLARQPDDGSDMIDAQATGAARIAVPLRQIVGLIGNFDCESLRLEAGAEGPLVIIGEPKLALISRAFWHFESDSVMTSALPPLGKIAELLGGDVRRVANKPTQYSGVRLPQEDLGQRAKATFTTKRATLTPKQRRTPYAPPKAC
jgi:hypothetical protein